MNTIKARVENGGGSHTVILTSNNRQQSLVIPPKSSGAGSSASGGELLFLALATCYCNDIYREAARLDITVKKVEVEVSGEFEGSPGSPATHIVYSVVVEADASETDILDLMRHTDSVAEIQNTLRQGSAVSLSSIKAVPTDK